MMRAPMNITLSGVCHHFRHALLLFETIIDGNFILPRDFKVPLSDYIDGIRGITLTIDDLITYILFRFYNKVNQL